jgi:pectinesterase
MHFLVAVGFFVTAVFATARTSPPSGAITVGSGGTYSTVRLSCRRFSKYSGLSFTVPSSYQLPEQDFH